MEKEIEKLREEGISDEVLVEEYLIKEMIQEHNEGKCNCDLTDGGLGLCYAGAYLEGNVPAEDILTDYGV